MVLINKYKKYKNTKKKYKIQNTKKTKNTKPKKKRKKRRKKSSRDQVLFHVFKLSSPARGGGEEQDSKPSGFIFKSSPDDDG